MAFLQHVWDEINQQNLWIKLKHRTVHYSLGPDHSPDPFPSLYVSNSPQAPDQPAEDILPLCYTTKPDHFL